MQTPEVPRLLAKQLQVLNQPLKQVTSPRILTSNSLIKPAVTRALRLNQDLKLGTSSTYNLRQLANHNCQKLSELPLSSKI